MVFGGQSSEARGSVPRLSPLRFYGPTYGTWYGPCCYSNRTACGQTYTTSIRGVATGRNQYGRYVFRCGQKLLLRVWNRRLHRYKFATVRVIDRCPSCYGAGHRFDLSSRTARDLCACRRPYTMRVMYRKGWWS